MLFLFSFRLVKLILITYFLRNIFLFLYKLYCLSKRISRIGPNDTDDEKVYDFLLQAINAAHRASLARYYYVLIFMDIPRPDVCSNDAEERKNGHSQVARTSQDGAFHRCIAYAYVQQHRSQQRYSIIPHRTLIDSEEE